MDEDWHAVYQAIYRGVEGAVVGELVHCNCLEKNKVVNVRSPGGSNMAKLHWKMEGCQKVEATRVTTKPTRRRNTSSCGKWKRGKMQAGILGPPKGIFEEDGKTSTIVQLPVLRHGKGHRHNFLCLRRGAPRRNKNLSKEL